MPGLLRVLFVTTMIVFILVALPNQASSPESKVEPEPRQVKGYVPAQTPNMENLEPLISEEETRSSPQEVAIGQDEKIEPVPNTESIATSPNTKEISEAHIPPLPPEILNEKARAALVNILCEVPSGPLRSTSGSGVIIDPRGIILTNAHVAQYFLLEKTLAPPSCTIRTGSPAKAEWHGKLVFLPSTWVDAHAKDIINMHARGTGENDYAFLAVETITGQKVSGPLPFVPLETAEEAILAGEQIVIAAYPAEFIGGNAARSGLYATTAFARIKQLLTFTEKVIDVLSVGGTALAQSGSSGGAFVNAAGSLVGLIVTTSAGDTTGERDLHALTPGHIRRSVAAQLGVSLETFLAAEPSTLISNFEREQFAPLSQKIQDAIALSSG